MIFFKTIFIISILIIGLICTLWKHSKKTIGTVVYSIRKGNHYSASWFRFPFFNKHRLTFTFVLGGGCKYDPLYGEGDINKLYGISFGFDPHYRSIRIGWRCSTNNTTIELYAYSYDDGKRKITYLCDVKQYETYVISIIRINRHCNVCVSDVWDRVRGNCDITINDSSDWIKFRLFPYFGGNKPAPHDMKIYINEK